MKSLRSKFDMNFDFTTWAKRTKFTFATCMFFTRSDDDCVEVYLDEIAVRFRNKHEAEVERLFVVPADYCGHQNSAGRDYSSGPMA